VNAVVIGAGMAGLVAARVLSDRYEAVTVVDRDALPDGSTSRRGVPQSGQPHVLLASGLYELDRLFPGIAEELTAAGAARFDAGLGLCAYRYGRRWPRTPIDVDLVSASRPLIESVVRGHVATRPGVTIRDRVAVTGLAGSGERITGVVLDTGQRLDADLVVDASGRGSRSDRWLAALGLPTPAHTEIKIGVTYTTRLYRRRGADDLDGWQAAFVLPTPPQENRHGVALPIEADRWIVTVGGWHIDTPPVTAAEFTAFAHSLPDPIIADLADRAEPLTDPVGYRFPASRRRDFDRLDRLPAGYVAVGDAFCSFNPIYGQGMTVAAMAGGALGAALDRHGGATTAAMARAYYRQAARLIATPWQFAVGGDFSFPQTTGPRPRGIALSNRYARRIALASQVQPDINATFFRVQQLLQPPSVLLRPAFMARVLWLTRPGSAAARGR
jgi:2-polyprenyl-6-methoxyphenol hydroxylase-like FAD-dependent oxidoreductase